jgi:serine protease Do
MDQPLTKKSTLAVLMGCFGVIVTFLSFGAGLAGGYLSDRFVEPVPAQPGDDNTTQTPVVIDETSAVIDVVEQNQDSVVSIIVTRRENQIGGGSGFVINETGLIVTNRHVVSDRNADYTVAFDDGRELEATVLARDTLQDIAFLKVDPGNTPLNAVALGTSEDLKVGQRVIAIGNSLGEFSGTVSYGIVSGLSRSIVAGDRFSGTTERLEGVIQTDASINPGNSGGPLFDLLGNVVGVNVAVAQDAENIGFAIPIDVVKRIISDVEQFGEIRRPYIGVRYRTVTPALAEQLSLSRDHGALIVEDDANEPGIIPNSPAAKAGLKVGDQILSIDGEKIEAEGDLHRIVQNKQIGDNVTVVFVRDASERTITVKLERLPE